MQIVYLSNRPQVMRETWQHVRHFMPWIDRALALQAKAASTDRFNSMEEEGWQG